MGRNTQYNKQTCDDDTKNINPENLELMKDFLDYLKSVDRSSTTIHGYENDLLIFFTYNYKNNHNKFFVDLSKREVMKYQSYLLSINNSPNRIRRLKSALSSLSIFIENILDEEYPNFRNIINKIESPVKTPTRKKTIMNEQQVEDLFTYLVDKKQYEKACALALAIASGSRKSELTRFKVDYFKDENIIYGCMYETSEEIKTKGHGSLGKPLVKYTFVKEFKPYLDLWMEQRKELGINNEDLFVVKDDTTGEWNPITIFTLNSWAVTFSRVLGIPFYWHSCRHLWTTNLKKKNLPDDIIVKLQGWSPESGSAMIAIYNDADITDSFGDFFDENGVKDNLQKNTLSNL